MAIIALYIKLAPLKLLAPSCSGKNHLVAGRESKSNLQIKNLLIEQIKPSDMGLKL